MLRIQEITFHLSSNKVIFSHLVELSTGNYVGEISDPYLKSSIPMTKTYTRLGSVAKNTPEMAFLDIFNTIGRICQNSSLRILEINNPCNCELIASTQQTTALGGKITIKVNDPV